MKKRVVYAFSVLTLALVFTGCKKNKDAETSDAKSVAVKTSASTKYLVNVGESSINWTGSKPVGAHTGTIAIEKGFFSANANGLESGTFLIDMKSITVTDLEGKEKLGLEGHLKGTQADKEDHFFDVNKFPSGAFEVTGTSAGENGKVMISGNLALKDKKHNITFPATISNTGDVMTITSDKFSIDRTKWGINYGSKSIFEDLGDKFINDDIEIEIKLTAKKA